MAKALYLEDEAAAFRAQLDSLREALRRVAWTGTCYRHPEYKGETDDRVNALAVLSGVATKDQYDFIFDVLKHEEHSSPYMEKYVMEALFVLGHGDYALERERRRYDFMVNHPDHDTLFENWNVGVGGDWHCGSINHAWSGGPLAVFPTRMLGLRPLEPGWKRFSVRPDPAVFDQCSISFPTVAGTVAVSVDRAKGTLTVTVPEGSEAEMFRPKTKSLVRLGPGTHKMELQL